MKNQVACVVEEIVVLDDVCDVYDSRTEEEKQAYRRMLDRHVNSVAKEEQFFVEPGSFFVVDMENVVEFHLSILGWDSDFNSDQEENQDE